jgi:membrane protein DedA with SNARE-associated domain
MAPIFNIDVAHILYDAVLNPTFLSAIWIFIIFLLGEAVAFLPLLMVLTAPVLFLKGSLTLTLLTKIFWLVAVPVGLGVSIGSLWLYGLAYWGGRRAVEKFGKYLYISWDDVSKAQKKLEHSKYSEPLLLGLRIVPFLPTLPVSVAAGFLRMRIWPYLIYTAVGMIVRVMIMVGIIGLGVSIGI